VEREGTVKENESGRREKVKSGGMKEWMGKTGCAVLKKFL